MRRWLKLIWIAASFFGMSVSFAEPVMETLEGGLNQQQNLFPNQTVEYPAAFFALYKPNTALDMVRQIPGFQLNDGDSSRGFASSAGNLLINGRRPSAKQDRSSAILARIAAGQVDRIELIRGQVRGVDLRGQSVVANVLLHSDIPAIIRWETWFQQNNIAPLKLGGNISLGDQWRNIAYNIGFDIERDTSGWEGVDRAVDASGVTTEERIEYRKENGIKLNGISFNASSWLGETFVQLNTKYNMNNTDYTTPSLRYPQTPVGLPREVLLLEGNEMHQLEMGIDAERRLTDDIAGKVILLYSYRNRDAYSSQRVTSSAGLLTSLRVADTETISEERIVRLEFDWSGLPNHAIQLNMEGAYNLVSGSLFQTDDTGVGPVIVEVPGANSRVNEIRGDFLIKDTWSIGKFELDYGLGAEVSTITQTGDEDLNRFFFYLKPQGTLSYSSGYGQQTKFRFEREVSQLNFNDFISSTVYTDDDLALGNPYLRPDKTWITELSYEQRFARASMVKITGFHHWITDVLDLLPLTFTFAVPGNIGDGRRWGLEFESTIPLDWLGLIRARLNLKTRWQNSAVTDPVTGENRILSGEGGQGGYRTLANRNKNNRYFVQIDYRQDLEAERVAWGWVVVERAERPLFKVNELDVYNEGFAIDAFVETTRWLGIKIRLSAENVLDDIQKRDRTFYTGERDLSPLDFRLLSERYIGRRISLSLSGNF